MKSSPLSILVVEDHLIVQQVIKNLLKSFDVEVDTANNGAQALEKIQSHDYSLITMDLGLPDLDGFEVTTKIHQWQRAHEHPLSLVVAISAHLGKVERHRCSEVGMIGAYEKPLKRETAEELLTLIKNRSDTEKADPVSHRSTHKGNHHASH